MPNSIKKSTRPSLTTKQAHHSGGGDRWITYSSLMFTKRLFPSLWRTLYTWTTSQRCPDSIKGRYPSPKFKPAPLITCLEWMRYHSLKQYPAIFWSPANHSLTWCVRKSIHLWVAKIKASQQFDNSLWEVSGDVWASLDPVTWRRNPGWKWR